MTKPIDTSKECLGMCEVESDTRTTDSYGLHKYEQKFTHVDTIEDIDALVPWEQRQKYSAGKFAFFSCLLEPQFWLQFDHAMRFTLICVLCPSVIIALDVPHNPFISHTMVFSAGILGARVTVGESIIYTFTWIRCAATWLPLAVIAAVIRLGESPVAWSFYYGILIAVVAFFTSNVSRRVCLLLFNICLMGLLVDPSLDADYPCRVMVDWSIGTGLCLACAFIPYPRFCKDRAQHTLIILARNTGTAFQGLAHSFWSSTNVERNLAMSKVRTMNRGLDDLLNLFEHYQAVSTAEFLFERTSTREIRAIKFSLFERLRVNLSSMVRVLQMVEGSPIAIDGCERAKQFGLVLQPKVTEVAFAFDELVHLLASATTEEEMTDLMPSLERFKERTWDLQRTYGTARRKLFYEGNSTTLEEFVPLMSFYLFTIISFCDTIEVFEKKIRSYKSQPFWATLAIVNKLTFNNIIENVNLLTTLIKSRNRREWQQVLEAAKVSAAMLLTVGFTYLIGTDKAYITGPNIIAFIVGFNTVEAVQASFIRLTGCLLGTVFGLFAGTYSSTNVQRIASLCTLMFVGTFLRNDKVYGIMSIYGMFVVIPLDAIGGVSTDSAVARMNQNTFGIFIYLFVIALVFPLSPRRILMKKRRNILRKMALILSQMQDYFIGSPEIGSPVCPNAADFSLQRSMFMSERRDKQLEQTSKELADVKKRLKSSHEIMSFTMEERGIIDVKTYPLSACNDAYGHMKRMITLLETMWMSWNVIRSQQEVTPEMTHMMENLSVMAKDISQAFTKFVQLMMCMVEYPAIHLEGEITVAVLELIECCKEFATRKSKIMVLIILESVKEHRGFPLGSSFPLESKEGSAMNVQVEGRKDVSVAEDLLRRHPTELATDLRSPVVLPKDFTIPISSEYAEGMHALALCQVMFADEAKLLMVALCSLLEAFR